MQTTKVEGKNLFFSKANLWVSILTLIALIAAIAKFTTVQKVDQGEKQSLEELTRQVAKIADTLTVKDQVAPNVLQVEKQGPVWGSVFGGTPQRKNIRMDCNIDGTPICCSMVNITQIKSHHKSHNSKVVNENDDHCVTSRLYVSSPYELEQLALGVKLSSITDGNERMAALVKQIYDPDEVAKSRVWLRRVEARMSGTDEVVTNEDDLKYLSRFETTRKCKSKVSTWSEFIEPITIHARHPFGMNEIINPQTMVDGISLISTDYVLLDSAQNIERRAPKGRKGNANLKKYFFDAGTSRFDSSLALFACTYAQVGIFFEQIFGWEMTLLEPQDFWKKVPRQIKPFYHFFNVPISATANDLNNPLTIIKDIAQEEDYVSFKLDVDTPAIEIPLAIDLLNDAEAVSLVDEFFFELHFHCEILTPCCWHNEAATSELLSLDRKGAMNLFLDLRKKGVRSHFWP